MASVRSLESSTSPAHLHGSLIELTQSDLWLPERQAPSAQRWALNPPVKGTPDDGLRSGYSGPRTAGRARERCLQLFGRRSSMTFTKSSSPSLSYEATSGYHLSGEAKLPMSSQPSPDTRPQLAAGGAPNQTGRSAQVARDCYPRAGCSPRLRQETLGESSDR